MGEWRLVSKIGEGSHQQYRETKRKISEKRQPASNGGSEKAANGGASMA